jgi:hypothetical protein
MFFSINKCIEFFPQANVQIFNLFTYLLLESWIIFFVGSVGSV